jgi:hypothetical protein
MGRCAYCQTESKCAACIAKEWKERDARKTFESLRDIERTYKQTRTREKQMNFLQGLLVVLASVAFVVVALDSTRKAMDYERAKPAILKAHGVE